MNAVRLTRRYVAAFALWQATSLVRGGQNNTVPLLTIPAIVVACWAFWKEHAQLLAIALFVAQVSCSPLQHQSFRCPTLRVGSEVCIVRLGCCRISIRC